MDGSNLTQEASQNASASQEEDAQTRISLSSSYSYDLSEPIHYPYYPNWDQPHPNQILSQLPHPDPEEQNDSYHSSEEDYVISPHPLDSPSPDDSPPSEQASSILLNTIPEHQEEQPQLHYQISIQTQNMNVVYTATSTSPTTARHSSFPSRNPTRSNFLRHSTQSTTPSSVYAPDHSKPSPSTAVPQQYTSMLSQATSIYDRPRTPAPLHPRKDEFPPPKNKEERLSRECGNRFDKAQPGGRSISIHDDHYIRLKAQFRYEQYSSTRELHEQEMRRLALAGITDQHAQSLADYDDSSVVDDGDVGMNFDAPVMERKKSKRRKLLEFFGAKKGGSLM